MNFLLRRILPSLLAFGFLSGCSSPSASGPEAATLTPEVVLSTFSQYTKATPRPVTVNYRLFTLCRGVDVSDVEAAEKTHGPHAYGTIEIFMNESALSAFNRGEHHYAEGAVIVKDKLPSHARWTSGNENEAKSRPKAVGGMIKRAPGSRPESGDWDFFYQEVGGALEQGAIASCVDCHENASSKDWVFGSWKATAQAE